MNVVVSNLGILAGVGGIKGTEETLPCFLNVLQRKGSQLEEGPSRSSSSSSCSIWLCNALRALLMSTKRSRRGSTPCRCCSRCSFMTETSKRVCCCWSRLMLSRLGHRFRFVPGCITHTVGARETGDGKKWKQLVKHDGFLEWLISIT